MHALLVLRKKANLGCGSQTPKTHIPSVDMGKVENSYYGGWSEMTELTFVDDKLSPTKVNWKFNKIYLF